MKPNSSKLDFKKISELIFFIGSFFMSGFVGVILIVSSINCDGLVSKFLFDYICIFVFLCFITFFIHITKFKNNKIHSWVNLITLITGCMSYIKHSPAIATNNDLFYNRTNPFSYLYRLLILILPFLFIFYYLCLAKDVPPSKKKIFVIVCYPLIYIISKTLILDIFIHESIKWKGIGSLGMGNKTSDIIFNILQLYSRFLLLIPCVLGILFMKKEILNKEKIHLILVYIGCGLVALSFGGFWYPFPFKQNVMKRLFKGTEVYNFLEHLSNYNEKPNNNSSSDHSTGSSYGTPSYSTGYKEERKKSKIFFKNILKR
ncbi:hypothetical protein CWO85_02975 [Candidatus Phytoplasma ziziphi]|uniref:Uncharacterized protein n=1 Tax=Ziziphus jujuba witches'-broom phytoplasma TaxID=135727 RepID=A0A660HN21_ZIZJU|nr:hypothetical protein [Candidatus Phytoplasma ziziphi]AYJ01441.1 hypothetical protein CWO85_02975 [Candidatus Phytoplasma ziziphi]